MSLDTADRETVNAVDTMICLGDANRLKKPASTKEPVTTESLVEYASRIKQKDFKLCNNMEEALLEIRHHEKLQGVVFLRHKQPKKFGDSDWKKFAKKRKVYWDNSVPYIKAANDVCIYECHQVFVFRNSF